MLITRRTFLQSSLIAGLAAAAEATCSPWLLSSSETIRIGIVGLGLSASEHLSLFAAIPGAEIVGITDRDPDRSALAVTQLRELGQRRPAVYSDINSLLADRNLHAISLPSDGPASSLALRRILAANLPLLMDFPPPTDPSKGRNRFQPTIALQTLVHFRLGDFLYPASAGDINAWLKLTKASDVQADLMLPGGMTAPQLRIVALTALDALLTASGASADQLVRWSNSRDLNMEITQAGTLGIISLPANPVGLKQLKIHLLGSMARLSTLELTHSRGSMRCTISSNADPNSSLQTVMRFMNDVRNRDRVTNHMEIHGTASRANVAAGTIDRFIFDLTS